MSAKTLPLFPLGTVLYPGGLLPLRIFEPRYLDMVRIARRDGTAFGIVPIRHGHEVGMAAHFHEQGTLATIESCTGDPDQLLHIRVTGGQRFRVLRHALRDDLLLTGEIELIADTPDVPLPDRYRPLADLLESIFTQHAEQVAYRDWQLDSALWVAWRLAEVLPLPLAERYALLCDGEGPEKLARITSFLARSGRPPGTDRLH
jgi:Lon protease-like protein